MTLTVAVDDPSPDNSGPADWAWHVDGDCWAAGGWESSTNNRDKLTTALELLRATEAVGLADEELLIRCDSQYVINSLIKWRHGWKKRGWRKADGKPVLSSDLVKGPDIVLAGHTVRFEWVRRHVGHPINEAADSWVRGAATAFQQGHSVSAGPSWIRGGRTPESREAQQAPSTTSPGIPIMPQTDTLF